MNRLARLVAVAFVTLLVISTFMLFWVEAAAEDSWTTKTPVPSSVSGVAVVNGKIYAFARKVTYEYNPITNAWLTKKPVPTPRSGFGIAVYENKIYVIGGHEKTDLNGVITCSPANEVYDPLTDTWESKASIPTPREQLEANVVNGKIYLIGGMLGKTNTGATSNLNEVYDPATDSWSSKASIPTGVYACGSAVVENKIYVIGGAGPKPPNLNQIYDTETDTWTYGAPIPTPVTNAAAGATTGIWAPRRIYVIGGRVNYGMDGVNINQVYNPENDSWSVAVSMPTARFQLYVAVLNDKLYAMDGTPYFNLQGVWCPENEQYTPIGYRLSVEILSLENKTYDATTVPLNFTVNGEATSISYSLDGQDKVAITGNTTLKGLSSGLHNLTVYVEDAEGNTGVSETIIFSVAEPLPTTWIVAAVTSVVVAAVSLLAYFVKFKKAARKANEKPLDS